jgi:hypothetical protein
MGGGHQGWIFRGGGGSKYDQQVARGIRAEGGIEQVLVDVEDVEVLADDAVDGANLEDSETTAIDPRETRITRRSEGDP